MAIGAAAFLLPQSQAGTFSANFNDNAVPAGTQLNGNTGDNNSGVIENGILKIVKNVNSKGGGFVIEDLDAGAPVYGFSFTGKILVGGGSATPADGFSLSFAPDIDMGAVPGEEGVGSAIRVAFDIYDNGGETPPAPSIDLRVGGNLIATKKMVNTDFRTDTTTPMDQFADISFTVTPAGAATLVYKGQTIFDNVYFPGYQPLSAPRLAIGSRTGGLNENVWFDDITLTTVTAPQVGVAVQPPSQTVRSGSTVVLAPTLNNVDGATFQWLKNGAPITGETTQTLTLNSVAVADNGAKYSLRITGPNNTVTTQEATLTVVDIPLPTPTASFDFNTDGTAPAGTTLFANDPLAAGYITPTGGIGDSGVLHVTDAVNGVNGGIIIEDVAAGAPVYGLTAAFKIRAGGGTVPPADGFSFNFAADIPDAPAGGEYENGLGTGLTVGFDNYDNGGAEAPSVDVRYGGTLIAQQKVSQAFLDTGDQFTDAIIRLENDGTLDVVWKGVVVFNNLTVPGFSQITGGRVAIAGRTGGLNQNVWVDDLALTTVTTAGDLRITSQPTSRYVVAGTPVTLSAGVNDATGVTFQWLRNGTAIGGATSAEYTFTPTAADNGALYSLRATRGGLTATSDAVTVTTLAITPTVSYNFDASTETPAGTILIGNPADGTAGYISATGGVNDSGVLRLTDNINGQQGAFIISPLLGGAEVAAINAAFDVRLGGGTQPPADGFSFNWAADLPNTIPGGDLENGAGTGLSIGFDIYDNGGGEGPSIDVLWRDVVIAQSMLTSQEIQTGDAFRTVIVKVTADGKLDLVYGDRVLQTGLQLPNYAPITNGKYAFYARTGGLNANQWVDNIRIEAIKSTAPLRIVNEPADILLIAGQTATFSVGVSDPNGVTYQWYRNGVAIGGATSATYTTPALTTADNGAVYTVTATGPGGAPTSRQAVATVVDALTIGATDVSFDFNDDQIPAGTTLNGGAGGGTISGGVLHLTDAVNGQSGTFFIPSFDNAETVNAFTANFKVLVGGGSAVPADGFSFVWANDISPESTPTFGEDGSGQGLTISFDTYDNQGGEAPAFDILYKGNIIATAKVPIGELLTGDAWADVFVRLQPDGTVDLQYNGDAIFNNVQLPGFEPLANAFFAWGGRTGGLNANQWIDDIKIVTTSSVAGPTMSIARNTDGTLTITWTGAGTLQSAPAVTGPWTDLTGVASPATIQATGAMQFFRVVQPAP